jgi:hypothetical protein
MPSERPAAARRHPPRVASEDLSREQEFALLQEMTSARNLLADGVRVVRTAAFIDTTRDPILTMLSIGVEKLYKLTLGLIALDETGRWPTKAEMKRRGHKLNPMHEIVFGELHARAADKSPYVRGLLADVEADDVVVPLINALDIYGAQGRFFYLDRLSDSPQRDDPDAAWQEIEHAAFADPTVDDLYRLAMRSIPTPWGLSESRSVGVSRFDEVVLCAERRHIRAFPHTEQRG